jgi:hypothetical protein
MTVISVSIEESSEQIMSGIPKYLTITTNVTAVIFYTLDGTTPTLFSEIYTGPIYLPTDKLSVIFKVFANDGITSSSILTETYQTNIIGNTRLAHSGTDAQAGENLPGVYPFGTNPLQPTTTFTSSAEVGVTVLNPDLPSTSTGFDGSGNETGFTNEPYNIENYQINYSTRDAIGQSGLGIGTLPAKTTINPAVSDPEETNQFTATFNPRAFVIFQDFSKATPSDPAQINRQFFTLEDGEKARDGNAYYNSGLDAPPVSGSFLRSHYNPKDNTMNYYYLDTWTNKWIISKQQYVKTGSFDGNMSGVVNNRAKGSQYVFEWLSFTRRVLF